MYTIKSQCDFKEALKNLIGSKFFSFLVTDKTMIHLTTDVNLDAIKHSRSNGMWAEAVGTTLTSFA